MEITQVKGSSETRPELSPDDEFAGFELIDNLLTVPRPSSIHGSYVREAYARGLEIEQRTGVNPFEFGLIGAADYHTGLPRSAGSDPGVEALGRVAGRSRCSRCPSSPVPSSGPVPATQERGNWQACRARGRGAA